MNAELHVYRIDTRVAADLPEAFFACLPDAELKRIQDLKRPQDRLNRRIAYAALLRLAARRSGVSAEKLRIVRNTDGKPCLTLPDGHAPVHASLSHSGRQVLIALAPCPVGIDVEQIRAIDTGLLRRDYFPRDAIAADAPASAFFALWTRKEAVLKAAGTGLRIDPASVVPGRRADAHPPSAFRPLEAWPPDLGLERACVADIPMDDGHAAAIAVLPSRRRDLPQALVLDLDAPALDALREC